ncbi:MAG: DegV family protein [Oscillospiraceae bacterium]
MAGIYKYALLTDSACDLPLELEKQHGIDILNFGIEINGKACFERQDFTPEDFYEILRTANGIPKTSQITTLRFLERFKTYDAAGCRHVLYVSINGTGSATCGNAAMAKTLFFEERPHSQMKIDIIDSHTYSMGYGWYVAAAARKLKNGVEMAGVVSWLKEEFNKVEIVLAAYSLAHMKKSGRISAAAAITGELLDIRPIIGLNGGESTVYQKVRGNPGIHPALVEQVEARRSGGLYMVGGTNAGDIALLAQLCKKRWGRAPACTFFLGSAVAANTGPNAIAIVFTGQPRRPSL